MTKQWLVGLFNIIRDGVKETMFFRNGQDGNGTTGTNSVNRMVKTVKMVTNGYQE
jgi:hypothetical protein